MKITPYSRYDGMPTFRDSYIVGLYDRMVEEGTAGMMFLEGCIKSSAEWLSIMTSSDTYLIVAHEDNEPLMVGWLNRIEYKRAHAHFCAFKSIWGKRTIEVGKSMLEYVIGLKNDRGYLLDLLWGVVPKKNVHAVNFTKACGAEVTAVMPNYIWNAKKQESEDGVMYCYTRGL